MILRFRSMLGIAMVVLHVDGLKDFIQMRYELEKNIYDQIWIAQKTNINKT